MDLNPNAGQPQADGGSLQDAFKKFRSRKKAQKKDKTAAELKAAAAARRALDPVGDNLRLREKFIRHTMQYIGTPYAERYHQPGDALYGRPLYLDCSKPASPSDARHSLV